MYLSWTLSSSKFLSDTEDQDLLSRLERDPSRDATMLLMLRSFGMRAGELLDLRKSDVNIANRSFLIRGTKGSNNREFPLAPHLFLRLMEEVDKCVDGGEHVFKIKYWRLSNIWGFYRPIKKGLHCLRHTFAISMYRKHKDIILVKNLLGHKFLTSTMTYQDFCYSQDRFKEVLVGSEEKAPA